MVCARHRVSIAFLPRLSSATEAFPLETQEAEENFDLALIAALEIDVVPHLGATRVPDSLVGQLAKVLHQGSRLYESEEASNPHSPVSSSGSREFEKIDMDGQYDNGSTQSGALLPRERFSYWCFDLLFLICSNTTKGKRVSDIALVSISYHFPQTKSKLDVD